MGRNARRRALARKAARVASLLCLCVFSVACHEITTPDLLRPGTELQRTIAAGDEHHYDLPELAPGAWLLILEQQGADLVLQLRTPDGHPLLGPADSPNGRWGPESLLFRAPVQGQLYVRASAGAQGGYRLQLRAISAKSPSGERLIEAHELLTSASIAFASGEADEWPRAQAEALEAAKRFISLDQQREAAQALGLAGDLQTALGQGALASASLTRARELWTELKTPPGQIQAGNQLGISLLGQGQAESAEAAFVQALDVAREWTATEVAVQEPARAYPLGKSLSNLGLAVQAQDRDDEAITLFEQALVQARLARSRSLEASVLTNLAGCHRSSGELDRALDLLSQASELFRGLEQTAGAARAVISQAAIHRGLGEHQAALDRYLEALVMVRQLGDRRSESTLLNNLGNAYLALGDGERARHYLERALDARLELGDRRGEGTTRHNLGRALELLEQPEQAEEQLRAALSMRRAQGHARRLASTLSALGGLLARQGRPEEARNNLQESLQLRRQVEDRVGTSRLLRKLAALELSQGRSGPARQHIEEALSLHRGAGNEIEEALSLETAARLNLREGLVQLAQEQLRRAIEIAERRRLSVNAPELRATLFAGSVPLYELLTESWMIRHRREPQQGHDARALRVAQQRRARSLRDRIANAGLDSALPGEPALAARLQGLRRRLAGKAERRQDLLAAEARASASTPSSDPATIGAPRPQQLAVQQIEQEIRDLLVALEGLEGRAKSSSAAYAELAHPPRMELADLARRLADDTLLLVYATGEEHSYLWLVGRHGHRSFALPGSPRIRRLVAAAQDGWRQARLGAGNRGGNTDAARASQQLAELLLGPVWQDLGQHQLLIVADGPLHAVPFALLPDPRHGGEPVLLQHRVQYLPAAGLLQAPSSGASEPRGEVLVVADPIFQPNDPRWPTQHATLGSSEPADTKTETGTATSSVDPAGDTQASGVPATRTRGETHEPGELSGWQRLPATGEEARRIAEVLEGAGSSQVRLLLGPEALRSSLLSGSAAKARWLHIATHGTSDSRSSFLSGLALSRVDSRGRPQTGFLGLRDIYGLQLSAQLVVLSGCDTALGRDLEGEGLMGLAHAFLYAGAERVVASLWQVPEAATAALMGHFYGALAKDMSYAEALRKAQVQVRAQPRWRAPYYWGAFVLQGRGR